MSVQTFRYEAIDDQGKRMSGTIEADSRDAAASSLTGRRLTPLAVVPTGTGLQREVKLPGLGGRTRVRDLAVMTRQFASMSASGLTLMRALAILEQQSDRPKLKVALGKVQEDLRSGSTLSKAMLKHPDQFPALMTSTIAAGETGGFLDQALDRVATMYEADAALRGKVKSALTYPLVVLVFSFLMMVGVIWFIVPVFERMFSQLGGELPLPTRFLVALSHNLWWWLPLVLVLVVGGQRGYAWARKNKPGFRLATDRLKLRVPVFGPLLAKIVISRWARNLATLLSAGVPITQALDMVGETSGSAVVGAAMERVRDEVRTGSPLSRPLAREPVFPPLVVQMLEVGEEGGTISDMLDKTAELYEEDVATATDALTSALEPVMVVIIGAVIGAMVICLYLPMFTIYQNIQTN